MEEIVKWAGKALIHRYIKRYYKNDKIACSIYKTLSIQPRYWCENTAAIVDLGLNTIFVNMEVALRNKYRFGKTFIHEFVHLYLEETSGNNGEHDKLFIDEMARVGFKRNLVRHNYSPAFKFEYTCTKCENITRTRRTIEGKFQCPFCANETFNWVIVKT